MFLKSLRTSIAVNIAFLLLLGMLLINFVMLIVTLEVLVDAETNKGRHALEQIKLVFQHQDTKAVIQRRDPRWTIRIEALLKQSDVTCSVIVGPDGPLIIGDDNHCLLREELQRMAEMAAASGMGAVSTRSSIQDVFWRQAGHIIVAEPLRNDSQVRFGAAVGVPLNQIYGVLRRIQHIFFIYILINAAILTLLGVYRLNKITVKPIQRLVTRAEEYRESEDAVFLPDKEDNEFSKLSKSLNSMLMRISRDKEKLQATVVSLEKANQELERAQLELVRAEKLASVGRLSAGIAHEIGNPIGIIKGYLELLKDDDLGSGDRTEFINRTETEVERINAIIRQLLDFARPSAHEQTLVHIHPILTELEEVCRRQPIFAGLKFSLDLRAQKDQVMADGRQLRQVFLNLILNAADAFTGLDSPEDNQLIIRTVTDPGNVKEAGCRLDVLFIDNGVGIPDEHLDYIFDPFYTTKEPGRGTGLGLAVSFAIIEGFGGTIQAAGNEMHGTTIRIRLPLAEETQAQTQTI